MRKIPLLLAFLLATTTQAQLVTLAAGSTAKASEVNGNFTYLASRLDSLAKALAAKDAEIASLRSLNGLADSLTKISKRLDAGIPKGTIAAFLVKPEADGYLPNSDKTWILAAGQTEINGLNLPNLRGVFLRGGELKFNVAGSSGDYMSAGTSKGNTCGHL